MEKSQKELSFKDLLRLIWQKSEPYRFGFLLGMAALCLTLVLIFTGRKAERLELRTKTSRPPTISSDSVLPAATNSSVFQSSSSSDSSAAAEVKGAVAPSKLKTPAAARPVGKINLNMASFADLESLPYIGPVIAQRIIDFRSAQGPFRTIEALDKVKGIGPKTIERIRSLVSLD